MKKILLFSTAILSSLISNSQTGPGGVGSSTNNVLWLDAEYLTYSTSPNISSWPDQSGNGNDFSQATGSLQPYKVNYTIHPAVRFRNDYLLNGGISGLNTTTISQYYVFEAAQPNHNGVILDAAYTQSSQFLRTERNNGNIKSLVLNNVGTSKINTTAVSSGFQIVSSIWDGATTQTFTSYKNGTQFGSQTGANGNPTGNYSNSIGATISGAKKLQDDIAEAIVYNTLLNSAEQKIVDNYLSSKYNIAIANDMYSYEATHRYQVIGIGQESDGNNLVATGKGILTITGSGMSDGSYLFLGHDNTNLTTTTNDVPVDISGGSRISRTWRVDVTGTPGNVDIDFDITSLNLPTGSYYLLVESGNGVFNDGGVLEYGPVADIGGLASFSSISLADGDYITLASGSNAGITSITSGFWDAASTWSCSCVPTSSDNVTISNGHTVTAKVTTSVNDLTVDGILNTVQISNFSIYGNYTIGASGNATHKGINFVGSAKQSIANNSASTIDLPTLVINNSSDVELVSGNFSISTSLKITAGEFQNNGATCTFTSNSSKTSVILNSATGNGISGNFIVQRFLSQRNANWADFSSPVTSAHLSDWDSDPTQTSPELFMCGVNGVSGNCGGFESVWSYDESSQTYVAVTDTSYALLPGRSVEVWLADDETTLYDKTFDSRGTPNFGNVVVPVSDSWNLVGNPYQAWTDWTKLTKPTLNSTYYIWNTNNGTYDAKTSGQIPPHQGFWVESVGSGILTFSESSKSNNGTSTFYKTANEDEEPFEFLEASLKVYSNKYNHELKLRMNDYAKTELDMFDASFLPSRLAEAPSITAYPKDANKHLAINSFNSEDNIIIPISIKSGVNGIVKIEPINFEIFTNLYKNIELIDTKTNISYNLKATKEIFIDLTSEEDDARFNLKLDNSLLSSNSNGSNVVIYKNSDYTIVEFTGNTESNYTVSVSNILGQKCIDDYQNINTNKLLIPNNRLPKGINIIEVKSANNVFIKKINY